MIIRVYNSVVEASSVSARYLTEQVLYLVYQAQFSAISPLHDSIFLNSPPELLELAFASVA